MGESKMENACASSSCMNLSDLICFNISSAPVRQYTEPCCWPAPDKAATLDMSMPWIRTFSKRRSRAFTHMIVGEVTLPFCPSWNPWWVLYSFKSWSNETNSSARTWKFSSMTTALIWNYPNRIVEWQHVCSIFHWNVNGLTFMKLSFLPVALRNRSLCTIFPPPLFPPFLTFSCVRSTVKSVHIDTQVFKVASKQVTKQATRALFDCCCFVHTWPIKMPFVTWTAQHANARMVPWLP